MEFGEDWRDALRAGKRQRGQPRTIEPLEVFHQRAAIRRPCQADQRGNLVRRRRLSHEQLQHIRNPLRALQISAMLTRVVAMVFQATWSTSA